MSIKSYRHKITGLVGEFADSIAEVFADVLEEVHEDTQPLTTPAPAPIEESAAPVDTETPTNEG